MSRNGRLILTLMTNHISFKGGGGDPGECDMKVTLCVSIEDTVGWKNHAV